MQSTEMIESTTTVWQDNYQSLTISIRQCLGINYWASTMETDCFISVHQSLTKEQGEIRGAASTLRLNLLLPTREPKQHNQGAGIRNGETSQCWRETFCSVEQERKTLKSTLKDSSNPLRHNNTLIPFLFLWLQALVWVFLHRQNSLPPSCRQEALGTASESAHCISLMHRLMALQHDVEGCLAPNIAARER